MASALGTENQKFDSSIGEPKYTYKKENLIRKIDKFIEEYKKELNGV